MNAREVIAEELADHQVDAAGWCSCGRLVLSAEGHQSDVVLAALSQYGYAVIPVDPESLERAAREMDEHMPWAYGHANVEMLRAALEALGVQEGK